MSDDKSKTVAERKRVNIHEDYELCFWSTPNELRCAVSKVGVSPNELRCAVSKVGVFADDVARELGILEERDAPLICP
jgi:uncharacterized protein DUF3606